MSKLITNTIRHTGGSADNITLDNSQNVTIEGTATVDGKLLVGTTQEFDSLNGRGNLVVGSGSGNEGLTIYSGTSNEGGIIFADGTSGSDAYPGQIQYNHGDNSMRFFTNTGAERCRILSGGGLTFNGDTAAANALDDYEEGTYNPTWVGITNYGSGYNDWYYTKIGRLVNILGTLRLNTTVNDGTDVSFTLPFTPKAQSGNTLNISVGQVMHNNVQTGSNGLCTYAYGGNAYGYFYKLVEDSSWTILEANDLSADDTIYVNFTYLT